MPPARMRFQHALALAAHHKRTDMRIIQISDTHISREHPSRTADLERCIEAINALDQQPDLVVHTGDVAHDGLPEEYELARQVLARLSVPYLVLPGNRDNRQELIRAFQDGRHIRVGMDFVQYSVEARDARLVFLDTASRTSNKGRFCRDRLAQAERLLAADSARPTLVFLHHPPFEVGIIPDPFQFESWDDVRALEALLARHTEVRSVICGHIHRNADGAVGAVQASAITCTAVDLRKGDAGRDGLPVFRTHYIP